MDEPLVAATTAALTEVNSTTHSINQFLNHVTFAQDDLEPVLIELFEFGTLLSQLGTVRVPDQLRPSLTWITRSGSDICTRMDAVLAACGDGPLRSRQWALTDAPVDAQELKLALEYIRRTMAVVFQAVQTQSNQQQIVDDIGHIKEDLAPKSSRTDALLVRCLGELENYIKADGGSGHSVDTNPTTSLPVQYMKSLSLASVNPTTSQHQASLPSPRTTYRSVSQPSSHPHPPLQTIQDEDLFPKLQPKDRRVTPAPLRLNQRKLKGEDRPAPTYTLFPPASPPPVKTLPPVPPPRSPRRPNTAGPLSSHSIPKIPPTFRARAGSDVSHVTHDSKFSSLSSVVTQSSITSQSSYSKPPPRSSSYNYQSPLTSPKPDNVSEEIVPGFEIIPIRRLGQSDRDGVYGSVFSIDTSPTSTILASRHDKSHIKISDVTTGDCLTTIKVPFYVQAQARSRSFFIRSHHILSETLHLVAIATGFGQTVEIWDWEKHKKLQTISNANRWVAVRDAVLDTRRFPLATYREDEDTISLYPVSTTLSSGKKPLSKPRTIDLKRAGLPHLPKFPELAYSSTGPLLVAVAGPRPPRPGTPPPDHAALLMAWRLDNDNDDGDGDTRVQHRPYKFHQPEGHDGELDNALPLCLVTYGSVAVSVWEPAAFRTVGRPGTWQVEPVVVTQRVVLVWDFGPATGEHNKTTTYRIPDVLTCVSPDCRFVAYCDPGKKLTNTGGGGGGGGGPTGDGGALVVLDSMSGRELWRLECASVGTEDSSRSSVWSGHSSSKSNKTVPVVGGGGLELLATNFHKVTELAFSGDGTKLFVGDIDGGVGIYEIREGIGLAV